jgi:DinB superfamily
VPDATGYATRLLAYTEGKDPLAMQSDAPSILADLIRGVLPAKLTARPAPDKWSVGEILAHLAEDELTSSWRYRQMLEHSGIALAGFDQDLWAKLGKYSEWKPQESLEMFRLLREANLRLLGALSPDQWQCFGVHTERGKITVRDLARHMAGHDINHIEQMRLILRPQGRAPLPK